MELFKIVLGISIPFLGTLLGAIMVFFLKDQIRSWGQKLLLGFAAGVMLAASIWSLLIPSMELSEQVGKQAWLPAVIGFLGGVIFLLILDTIIPHLHVLSQIPEGKTTRMKRPMMMALAVTLHNIPEGMAVGVVFSGMLSDNQVITTMGAFSLAIGIAIQNFPEGALVSMPMVGMGVSKRKAFQYGIFSGIVEPLGALLMIGFAASMHSVLPYFLAFAAGAMIYVVVEELIPESQMGEHSNIGTIGTMLGFTLMMFLDVALGG